LLRKDKTDFPPLPWLRRIKRTIWGCKSRGLQLNFKPYYKLFFLAMDLFMQ
jgi:hypothetical protein